MADDSGNTPVSEGADDIVQRFFTILKRGVYGIWHTVSDGTCTATSPPPSSGTIPAASRTAAAIRGAAGKHLTYRPVTA